MTVRKSRSFLKKRNPPNIVPACATLTVNIVTKPLTPKELAEWKEMVCWRFKVI